MNSFGVYVHFPFCRSKCPYCDFNSIPVTKIPREEMKKSYVRSLDFFAKKTHHKTVTSIFFGGGTPSLASVDTISFVIDEIKKRWPVVKDAEILLNAGYKISEITLVDQFAYSNHSELVALFTLKN